MVVDLEASDFQNGSSLRFGPNRTKTVAGVHWRNEVRPRHYFFRIRYGLRTSSGSFAMFAAIRGRASSLVSSLAAARLPGSSSK